ncbi:MAG: DNA-binding protein [unclassified Hahellaceae]|nr:DNA-binding protein [Hahellaceae bacterium]|tara:strand:- start:35575 stop:36549 length:975 start_codon:yes stop_codon:yes gene_type:complete
MEFKDYYAVLGVDPSADDKAIKTAYRKLARQYHPDVSKATDAETRFKEVSEAYEVLKNRDKRAEYDALREARQRGYGGRAGAHGQARGGFAGAGAGAGEQFASDTDFTDFFNSIFGGAGAEAGFGRHQSRRDSFQQKGRDFEMEWPVLLEETLTDRTVPVDFSVPQTDGRGQVQETRKSLKVKIPAGVRDGERIRLKGQGGPGMGNGPSGDLYLHIRLVPHPLFDVEGDNLVLTLPLAPWEAALGTKVTVPTLTGKVNLSIPPKSQSGQRLRIKGKGLVGKHGTGDLYAVLKIVLPRTDSDDVKKLWSQLAEQASFDPREEWSI